VSVDDPITCSLWVRAIADAHCPCAPKCNRISLYLAHTPNTLLLTNFVSKVAGWGVAVWSLVCRQKIMNERKMPQVGAFLYFSVFCFF
jgi:hypothetical protein